MLKTRDQMIMLPQKPDYTRIKTGNIFAMKYGEHRFLFGRIISEKANVGGFLENLLIYVYKTESISASLIPILNKNELLIPPFVMTRSDWRKGFLRTVKTAEVSPEDILPQHCFWSFIFR